MNLLKEGIENHTVQKTTLTRKLTVDGITKAYPVYRIRLDQLFYNDQNDRIATWISKYKTEHDGQMPDIADRAAFNDVIEQFIIESNPDAIKRTQNNIELVDQREPGVVLTDGRIIDGNRRFTCLRRLSQKNDRFSYFEAVILDRNIDQNAKEIKRLELSIQHGEESKVDYNPIDRLVGVYNDVIESGMFTVKEYADATNETESDVNKRVEVAKLMIEFLEFINAPKQFFIARDLQISFYLEELSKLKNKCKTEDEYEELKLSVFNNIIMQPTGDLGRYIRSLKTIIGSDYQTEFFEEQRELAEKTLEKLPPVGKVTVQTIRDDIRSDESLADEMKRSVEKVTTKVKKNETRNRPIQLAEKATSFLEDIDANIIDKMNDSELKRMSRQLDRLEEVIAELREHLA